MEKKKEKFEGEKEGEKGEKGKKKEKLEIEKEEII